MKFLFYLIFLTNIIFSKTYNTNNPPMIYVYSFVSSNITEENNTYIDPETISTMISTVIGKYPQLKFAGESLQEQFESIDIINLLKPYKYPENTDYILFGEVNVIGKTSAYSIIEIDFQLIDISMQEIISSNSISVPFSSISELRKLIFFKINSILQDLLKPFCGNAYIKVKSENSNRIRWDLVVIRPKNILNQGKIITTEDYDYLSYNIKILENGNDFKNYFNDHQLLIKNNYSDTYAIFVDENEIPYLFLPGNYYLKAHLVDNEDPMELEFNIISSNMNEISIYLPDHPKLDPPPLLKGNISIKNLQNGMEVVVERKYSSKRLILNKQNNQINILENSIAESISQDKKIILLNRLSLDPLDQRKLDDLPETIENSKNLEDSIVKSKSQDKKIILLNRVSLGEYTLNATAISTMRFPGKVYTNIFSQTENINILKNKESVTITLDDIQKYTDKSSEIIIYLNPFIQPDDLYTLHFGTDSNPFGTDSNPFIKIRNAAEVHILGINPEYSGYLTVKRDGYKSAIIPITPNYKKFYTLANLVQPSY